MIRAMPPRTHLLLTVVLPLLVALLVVWQRAGSVVDAEGASYGGDFRTIIQGGRMIFTADARKLYVASVPEREEWLRREGDVIGSYLYPPSMAVFMAPFAAFSNDDAFSLWKALTTVSMVIVGGVLAMSFRARAWGVCALACVLTWDPLLLNLTLGQTGALAAAMLAIVSLLISRDRVRGLAAAAAVSLKVGALLGPALLAWEEGNKTLIAFASAVAVVVLLPFVLFGPDAIDAIRGWSGILREQQEFDLSGGNPYNQSLTTLIHGEKLVVMAILAACLCGAVFLVSRIRNVFGWEAAIAVALAAGLVVTPHSLVYDWGIAMVAVAFLRRATSLWPDETWADVGAGAMTVLLFLLGQYAFGHFADRVQVLTLWAVAFCLVIGGAALWTRAKVEPVPAFEAMP